LFSIWYLLHDHMVVGFTTTYAISAYHHWCCEFESRSRRGTQQYVIKFVSDFDRCNQSKYICCAPHFICFIFIHFIYVLSLDIQLWRREGWDPIMKREVWDPIMKKGGLGSKYEERRVGIQLCIGIQIRVIMVFPVFRLLTDFVCLFTYKFWLSLWKIVRSSVILLLPLFGNAQKWQG
jgi:hypothetical protein